MVLIFVDMCSDVGTMHIDYKIKIDNEKHISKGDKKL